MSKEEKSPASFRRAAAPENNIVIIGIAIMG